MRLSAHTDGFIIGSALIEMTDRTWADVSLAPEARLDAVRRFVHALKYGDSET